eukprot:9520283-Karenia_brevis.AAC.1
MRSRQVFVWHRVWTSSVVNSMMAWVSMMQACIALTWKSERLSMAFVTKMQNRSSAGVPAVMP